jgi:hypothetical protein
MTRTGLQDYSGRRHRFGAVFAGRGSRSAFLGSLRETLLFRDLYDAETGAPVSDHVWVTAGNWSAGLRPNDVVEFDARVVPYVRGYFSGRRDVDRRPSANWQLVRPTRVAILTERVMPAGAGA